MLHVKFLFKKEQSELRIIMLIKSGKVWIKEKREKYIKYNACTMQVQNKVNLIGKEREYTCRLISRLIVTFAKWITLIFLFYLFCTYNRSFFQAETFFKFRSAFNINPRLDWRSLAFWSFVLCPWQRRLSTYSRPDAWANSTSISLLALTDGHVVRT